MSRVLRTHLLSKGALLPRAATAPVPRGPAVLAQLGVLDGCGLWRVLQPYTELNRLGFRAFWDLKDAPDGDQVKHSLKLAAVASTVDAVVLPRQSWNPEDHSAEVNWFRALHNAKKAIIYEVDDDMFSEGFVQRLVAPPHEFTREYAESRRDAILGTLRRCDGVTVSSQHLATIVRNFTDKPVEVVKNYIDLVWWRQVQKAAASGRFTKPITIGWAGGMRPDKDFDLMIEAWKRIALARPDVTFLVQGHYTKAFEAVPGVQFLPFVDIAEYPVGYVNFDIGCCPLMDTRFNRAKTPIKALEYGASRAAVVASPTVYRQVITHNETGLIAETADEWEAALLSLVDDEALRRRLVEGMEDLIESQWTLRDNVWRWPQAWSTILEDFRAQWTPSRILLPSPILHSNKPVL